MAPTVARSRMAEPLLNHLSLGQLRWQTKRLLYLRRIWDGYPTDRLSLRRVECTEDDLWDEDSVSQILAFIHIPFTDFIIIIRGYQEPSDDICVTVSKRHAQGSFYPVLELNYDGYTLQTTSDPCSPKVNVNVVPDAISGHRWAFVEIGMDPVGLE